MPVTAEKLKNDILEEMGTLPPARLREVLDFVQFLKVRGTVDPAQVYFWTRAWQRLEQEVEEDKRAGRILGDGTVKGLLRELKR